MIALKCRTAPVDQAVAACRAALAWLKAAGAQRFYWKYCSTFDSTATGNIGPVAEALMDDLQDVGNGGPMPSAATTWTFSGLPDVAYDVYVYAWAPDSTTFISFVGECGATASTQVSGGWPGGHVEGVSESVAEAEKWLAPSLGYDPDAASAA
mgnify:CR=1 FL=1